MKTIYVGLTTGFGLYPEQNLSREYEDLEEFRAKIKQLIKDDVVYSSFIKDIVIAEVQLHEDEVYVISEGSRDEYITIEPREIKSKINILSL